MDIRFWFGVSPRLTASRTADNIGMSENLNPGLHRLSVVVAILVAVILLTGAVSKLMHQAETLGVQMADQDAAAFNLTK